MMNVQDWLPTLYRAAGEQEYRYMSVISPFCDLLIEGGDPHADLPAMDGMDLWEALSADGPSPRNLMLHNIDEHRSIASVRVAEWKLSRGSSSGGSWDSWYGPSGRDPGLTYDVAAVRSSPAGAALGR